MPGPIGKSTTGNEGQLRQDGLLRWRSIDVNDPSWTEYDFDGVGETPTGLVQSITTTTSGMQIVTDNADFALRWDQTNQTSPRYYTKLQGPGTLGYMSWAQAFSIEFLCTRTAIGANDGDAGSSNNKWDASGIVVGIGDESVTNEDSSAKWTGAGFYNRSNDGSVFMRFGGDGGVGDLANAAGAIGYHVLSVNTDGTDADGDTKILRGAGLLMNSSGQSLTSTGMTQQSQEYDGTEPVYLFVSPTFYSTVTDIDADTDTTWKLWYRIRVALDGVAPDYIPGDGYSG